MAKGLALHIGLNHLDPQHYQGWPGTLGGCEADAACMKSIASGLGYGITTLLNGDATRNGVADAIRVNASQLEPGDIFLVTYSGHGGFVPDQNGDEEDGTDETWCLYDGQLIDDELFMLWQEIAEGVRVLVLSDSCHSGTVTRDGQDPSGAWVEEATKELHAMGVENPRFRFMPAEVATKTYFANKSFYDDLGEVAVPQNDSLSATVRLLSGCQDNQTSGDTGFNGVFTNALLRVWNKGKFQGNYDEFLAAILKIMPASQQPNHTLIGPPMPSFNQEKPFAIVG